MTEAKSNKRARTEVERKGPQLSLLSRIPEAIAVEVFTFLPLIEENADVRDNTKLVCKEMAKAVSDACKTRTTALVFDKSWDALLNNNGLLAVTDALARMLTPSKVLSVVIRSDAVFRFPLQHFRQTFSQLEHIQGHTAANKLLGTLFQIKDVLTLPRLRTLDLEFQRESLREHAYQDVYQEVVKSKCPLESLKLPDLIHTYPLPGLTPLRDWKQLQKLHTLSLAVDITDPDAVAVLGKCQRLRRLKLHFRLVDDTDMDLCGRIRDIARALLDAKSPLEEVELQYDAWGFFSTKRATKPAEMLLSWLPFADMTKFKFNGSELTGPGAKEDIKVVVRMMNEWKAVRELWLGLVVGPRFFTEHMEVAPLLDLFVHVDYRLSHHASGFDLGISSRWQHLHPRSRFLPAESRMYSISKPQSVNWPALGRALANVESDNASKLALFFPDETKLSVFAPLFRETGPPIMTIAGVFDQFDDTATLSLIIDDGAFDVIDRPGRSFALLGRLDFTVQLLTSAIENKCKDIYFHEPDRATARALRIRLSLFTHPLSDMWDHVVEVDDVQLLLAELKRDRHPSKDKYLFRTADQFSEAWFGDVWRVKGTQTRFWRARHIALDEARIAPEFGLWEEGDEPASEDDEPEGDQPAEGEQAEEDGEPVEGELEAAEIED